jgi:hypothetical protein
MMSKKELNISNHNIFPLCFQNFILFMNFDFIFLGGTLTVSYFPSIHFVIWAEKSKAKSKSIKNSLATNTDHCKFIAYLQLYKYTNKSRVLWRSWNVDLLYKLKLGAVSENVTLWKMTVAITDRKLSPTSYL